MRNKHGLKSSVLRDERRQLKAWAKQDYQPCDQTSEVPSRGISATVPGTYVDTQYGFPNLLLVFRDFAWAPKRLAPRRSCTSRISKVRQKGFSRFLKNVGGSCCKDKLQKTERQEASVGLVDLQQRWVASSLWKEWRTTLKAFHCVRLCSVTAGFIKIQVKRSSTGTF